MSSASFSKNRLGEEGAPLCPHLSLGEFRFHLMNSPSLRPQRDGRDKERFRSAILFTESKQSQTWNNIFCVLLYYIKWCLSLFTFELAFNWHATIKVCWG